MNSFMSNADEQRELEIAYSLHRRGAVVEAARSYRALIKRNSKNFHALQFLGLIEAESGNVAEAKKLMARSLSIRPANIQFVENYATLLYQMKDYQSALQVCRDGLRLNASNVPLSYLRAISLMRLGRLDESLLQFDKLLALKPDYAIAHNEKGHVLAEMEQYQAALACVDKALSFDPKYADAYLNKGNLHGALKQFDEALAAYDEALAIRPEGANIWLGRGNALRELKRYDEAFAAYDRAAKKTRDFAGIWFGRANVFRDLNRASDAIACYDKALALNSSFAEAWLGRGNVLLDQSRPGEALTNYDKALALNPRLADAFDRKGRALLELGRLKEASREIEKSIKLAPRRIRFYLNLGTSRRIERGEGHIEALEALAREMPSLSADDQIDLNFALGKALADLGERERSFRYLIDANALKRKQIAYDEPAVLDGLARGQTIFTPELLSKNAGAGEPSSVPVFIVGMPRSGTTLIEQILASHPRVFGAGEINDFGELAAKLAGDYPESVAHMSRDEMRELGGAYLERIKSSAPQAERIVNKMPDNFRFVGLIHLALPNARIIHTRRDPFDTCLSCFSQSFGGDLAYAYELGELGRYYCAYEALMAHWTAILPQNFMLDVQYEDVVDDLEHHARRILAHCGLEWDAACLDFQRAARPVRTASVAQVRQPLYKSSIGRWRAYEPFLGPLLAELGPPHAAQSPTE